MKQMKKNTVIPLTAVFVVIIAVSCVYALFFKTGEDSKTDVAMGTVITVKAYGRHTSEGVESAVTAVKNLDSLISKTAGNSDINKINADSSATVNEKTVSVINKTLDVCKDSTGALDITVGNLSEMWDIGGDNQRVPSDEELQKGLSFVGYQNIKISGNSVSVPAGVHLDLGASGKGAGADEAVSALKNTKGVSGAVVSVGGTVGVFGKNPNSDHWGVGVRKPERDNTGYIAVIKLYKDSFVSTSGSYEKYFESDGKTYHHILSPFTGCPAESGLKSVTVVTYDSGVYADSLSTACFVLGYEKSLELLEKYSADAFFIMDDGSVKMTDGIKDNVTMNE